jgi:hypothetical protein
LFNVLLVEAEIVVLIDSLSFGEKKIAALFSDEVLSLSCRDLQYSSYLTAQDIFAVIYRISKPLRKYLVQRAVITPGLFRTEYGQEFQCSLHEHQISSLRAMLNFEKHLHEGCAATFGTLRGGVLADEPGLGECHLDLLSLGLHDDGYRRQDGNSSVSDCRNCGNPSCSPTLILEC